MRVFLPEPEGPWKRRCGISPSVASACNRFDNSLWHSSLAMLSREWWCVLRAQVVGVREYVHLKGALVSVQVDFFVTEWVRGAG